MKSPSPTIVLLGAGNVGYQLGQRLLEKGFPVVQVFSRSIERAAALGRVLRTDYTNDWLQINKHAGLYIIAVKDDVIAEVAEQLSGIIGKDKLAVHTSGSVPMSVLAPYFDHYGSFYPLQTFSMAKQPDFDQIPICIAANGQNENDILEAIGNRISSRCYTVNDEQRAVLHIAAVVANNFTNHLYHLAETILADQQLPFDLLKPLILETATKIQENAPLKSQTGPAVRGDKEVIEKHLNYLKVFHPEIVPLYENLTRSIQKNKR